VSEKLSYTKLLSRTIIALLGVVALVWAAPAQEFPHKPVRILAGAAAGGLIDQFARTFGQKLQERSGQPVVVENNPLRPAP
jgi:tripartite-type tricarboxylate transporter receptor subunit TctC